MTTLKLTQANIVVLANAFNPSIASKDWLQANVVHQEPTNFVNTPLVSVFETAGLHLLVDQSRLQATCKDVSDKTLQQCAEIVESYVKKLPHTPYKAIGFNYVWEVTTPTALEGSAVVHNGCSCRLPSLASDFDSYAVGPVVVARKVGCRIRAAVEPSLEPGSPVVTTVNYHYDESSSKPVSKMAGRLLSHVSDSEHLVLGIFEGGRG